MADNYNPADNLSEEARSKGGKASSSSNNKTSGRGSKEGQRKGGRHSHDNQYTS